MRRILWMLLCTLCLWLAAAGAARQAGNTEREYRDFWSDQQVAWWTLLVDRPNPERLPVKIRFQWVKGLEQLAENR